ncbi:hypothetical protein SDC9_176012 [bioreactor metagenome]|uniref:Uncharacterized protein n=1 Tax=bioreactor metagenome TaxID=1076179 RepID=A0A645GQR4_9ZZZZ
MKSFISLITIGYKFGFTDKIKISVFLATSLLAVVIFIPYFTFVSLRLFSFRSATVILSEVTILAFIIPPIIAVPMFPQPINPIVLFITYLHNVINKHYFLRKLVQFYL